ncbi:MAG: GNAT family N-acetyltransferase [Oscillospiraceae bacterium]|nr:GNAT family N-acetyltransferase [Oscillospiraceae bacterium]
MIILITGPSHVGKTLLAQRMLERYHYPYLSIDHLKMGLIRSGNTTLTPEDDGELTAYLWPVVREIIKTAVENKQNLIVEGCYVPFFWRRDFGEGYLSHIRFICLAMSEEYVEAHFDEIIAHQSDIEERFVDPDCTVGGLQADNRRCIDGFRRAGETVTLIDGDYKQTIRTLLQRDFAHRGSGENGGAATMTFIRSSEMKVELTPEQAEMLSTRETIRQIIRENPNTVMAFDIFEGDELIGFVLVHRFEDRKYFLWEYAIDVRHQNRHKGTEALKEFIGYMKANHDAMEITTTYIYGNDQAKHVYEKVGFVETDVVDEPDCHEVNMAYYVK